MKKISFLRHILPHLAAVVVFWGTTVIFFNPIFFTNKVLSQHDISQFSATAKSLQEYRAKTGKEGLWAPSIFGGMPGYLVQINWHWGGYSPVYKIKQIFAFGLPHPVFNIYWAFLSYYILLLAFRVRPLLAIAGALAFGLSSHMIIGLGAGHNSRIGAIAYMPLIMAGVHLAFSKKRWLGFGVTALGMSLQLRENHLQMTYYLLLIVFIYGLVQLVVAVRNKNLLPLCINVSVLVLAVGIAVSSFIAPLWAIAEYSRYSIRGPSELKSPNKDNEPAVTGLNRDYAFSYSNGITEPMTLLIPDFYGGSSSEFLVRDVQSEVFKVLTQQRDPAVANQLARHTSAYWGEQPLTAPYYAGAVIVFLFVLGVTCVDKKYVWWLVSVSVLGIVLSWGKSFPSFNYFIFDYLPGYNKFRSVTFTITMPLFAMPLLAMLGLENILNRGLDDEIKKKFRIVLLGVGGLLLLLLLFAGARSFLKEGESQLPGWFLNALTSDRKSLFLKDTFRSLVFISIVSGLFFFTLKKKISHSIFSILLAVIITIDLVMVDRRYFGADNYQRRRNSVFPELPVDKEILKDKDYYRVHNIQESWSQEGRTAYFHNSIGGYHGAKLRRFQQLYDSCLRSETATLIADAQQGRLDFEHYAGLGMLNVRYIIFGPQKNNFMKNPAAGGNAWFVKELKKVNSPTEELVATCHINPRMEAVIDKAKFDVGSFGYDSSAAIVLKEFTPPRVRYTSSSSTSGLAVFSEIFYPVGWHAFIDGREVPILRVNYLLRALEIPAGKHDIEFRFEPLPYLVGSKVMTISSWVLIVLLLGSLVWSFKGAMINAPSKVQENNPEP